MTAPKFNKKLQKIKENVKLTQMSAYFDYKLPGKGN